MEAVTYNSTGAKFLRDFNGDGNQDFLGTSSSNGVAVFLSNGAGGSPNFTISAGPQAVCRGITVLCSLGMLTETTRIVMTFLSPVEMPYLYMGSGATSNLTASDADVVYQQTGADTFFAGVAGDLDNDGFAVDFCMAKAADNTV